VRNAVLLTSAVLTLLLLSGCGTIANHTMGPGVPYNGLMWDGAFFAWGVQSPGKTGWLIPVAVIDCPLTLAGDTLLLPVDIWGNVANMRQGNVCEVRIKLENEHRDNNTEAYTGSYVLVKNGTEIEQKISAKRIVGHRPIKWSYSSRGDYIKSCTLQKGHDQEGWISLEIEEGKLKWGTVYATNLFSKKISTDEPIVYIRKDEAKKAK
jgi:uncharacterized protein YceK